MTIPGRYAPALLLTVVAGCAMQSVSTGTRPAAEGPRASIHAEYSGGILNRQANAVFKVDESAYVMIAHLGGDGRFEVVYPDNGRESGYVPAGKWFRTPTFTAFYDGAPQLYSFAMLRYRTAGAQLDSYDGRGYGFVFLVAARHPLRFDRISDFGLWRDLYDDNYGGTTDPRHAVREFASIVAGGQPYTLQFARNFSTVATMTYADARFDCAYLSEFAYLPFVSPYSYTLGLYSMMEDPFGFRHDVGCGGRYAYSGLFDPNFGFYTPSPRSSPPPSTPSPPPPRDNPLERPPHRTIGTPGSGLSFGDRTLPNSPDNPAPAPHDWVGGDPRSSFPPSGNWDRREWPRAGGGGSGGSTSGGATRVAPVEQPRSLPGPRPVERPVQPTPPPVSQPAPRPVEPVQAKPVIDREKP